MRKYELSISADYVPEWGVVEATREFFQNSIDEETRDASNKMFFSYDSATQTIRIGNKHSDLDIKTLLFGVTTKNKDSAMIGNHGEGYKIATVVFSSFAEKRCFLQLLPPGSLAAPACKVQEVRRRPGSYVLR